MSAPSPSIQSGSLVSFTLKAEGSPVPTTFQVLSIETWAGVNRVPKARLVIYDGDPSTGDFPISNLDTFLPGKKVTIAAGYAQKDVVIFDGVVVAQGIEIDQDSGSRLVVDLVDKALAMTLERKSVVFEKKKDSEVIQALISDHGLSGSVTATTALYEDVVQYDASDWDLMVMRAELNGFVVLTEGGKLTVAPPDTKAEPALHIEYGDGILDLDARMNAASQYASSAIKSYAWDDATQKVVQAGPGSLSLQEIGNVSSEELAKAFGVKAYAQRTGAEVPSEGLQAWSTAELLRSRLSKIRGQVRFQGSARAKAGCTVELAGLGDRFNGVAYVSAVRHQITESQWTTTATFGLDGLWFAAEARNIAAPGAAGQLPPVRGLQTGVVQKMVKDPQGEFRVQIKLPILGDDQPAMWARLGSFYASNKIGAAFFPEEKDEVIVGFMNDDPRYPVILGSVYSKTRVPPRSLPDEANGKKAIVTRGDLELSFDDEGKIITIATPGKRRFVLDDKDKKITLTDGDRNSITMSSAGIEVKSGKDLILEATGKVTLKAGTTLAMSAAAEATLKAAEVALKADATFQAKGAIAEISASGVTSVKGALVNIN